jgi:hypothetical protein
MKMPQKFLLQNILLVPTGNGSFGGRKRRREVLGCYCAVHGACVTFRKKETHLRLLTNSTPPLQEMDTLILRVGKESILGVPG